VMMLERDKAYIAEVGDSRAYIIRDGRIKQLTTDQTMVQMLVDYGAISPEDAAKSSNKNVLLQAIGNQEFLQVAVTSINIQANDLFLLCSDGLSGKVQAKEIKEIVVKSPSLEAASTEMIELAKRRGGEDNITVVIARVEGNGLKAKAQAETLTKQIQVLSKYDPSQDVVAKPKREVRPATFQDWLNSAVIDSFCRQQEQKSALAALEDFGEYIVFRKGDLLVSPNEPNIKEHYWLVAGRYRVMIEVAGNDRQMIGFFVPPTDQRLDADIQDGDPLARVRRQFFIANLNMLGEQRQNAIIRCEDEENAVIRIPDSLFEVVAPIFGERYVNIVRHS
ncbi:MAG: serine/threonine-protein phosphatase, partial [Blastocatellia bacterium]|nr:serine/threonine-protein phosphatase [Blastocatellia bacterium]